MERKKKYKTITLKEKLNFFYNNREMMLSIVQFISLGIYAIKIEDLCAQNFIGLYYTNIDLMKY